ncbi:MAG: ADP-ribosylation factor-like protein [Acidobacteriota bacterium]
MVIYNAATRELTAKIVYYGPGLGGKTTNLHLLHERLEPATVGKLLNLATQTDRTIYFDLLPVELGDIKGYKIRFQLATVPGQTAFNETRRVVLKGTDGIVFVADSQWTMLPKNLESWQNLKENLKANGVSFEGIPIVIQYNKRDLSDILSVDALQEALGLSSYPFVEAVASAGRGVTETFKLISKLTFVDLLRRLQGRKPEEAGPVPPRREPDDLLSWKDSLLNRGAAPPPAPPREAPAAADPGSLTKRPLALVPSLPDEAPFETDDAPDSGPEVSAESGAPFSETGASHRPAGAPSAYSDGPPPPSSEAWSTGSLSELSLPALPTIDDLAPTGPVREAAEAAGGPSAPAPEAFPGPSLEPLEFLDPATALDAPSGMEHDAGAPARRIEPSAPAPRLEDVSSAPAEPAEAPRAAASSEPAANERTDARFRALEAKVEEAVAEIAREREERRRAEDEAAALTARLEGVERQARDLGKTLGEKHDSFEGRIQALAGSLDGREDVEARIREAHDRISGSEKRQRTYEDDVSISLRSFGERGEKVSSQIAGIADRHDRLQEQIATIHQQIEVLEAALREKTSQSRREADDIRTELQTLRGAIEERIGHGHREAEDIRSQIAPLLEAHGQRGADDERLSQEFDRLRESLADSLGDLSERLRRAVRGA